RAVALLLDVLEVIGRRPACRVVLAHVADPAGELGEALSGGGAALPLHPEVLGLQELGPGDQRDARGAEDFHRVSGARVSGVSGSGKVELRRGPAGGPFELAQASGDV